MDNPAQPSDLAALGYEGPASTVVQTAWLDVTWRALRREVRTLEADLNDGTLTTEDIIDVITAATLRVLRNPDGVEQEDGRIDDYAESWRRADATQDVYFTTAELRRLAPTDTWHGGWVGSVKYD